MRHCMKNDEAGMFCIDFLEKKKIHNFSRISKVKFMNFLPQKACMITKKLKAHESLTLVDKKSWKSPTKVIAA